MFAILFSTVLFAAPFHGGQYQPPNTETGAEPGFPETGLFAQPGLGPELEFEPSRWEWWFDFNQEHVINLRQRFELQTGRQPYEPVLERDRIQQALPVVVNALRREPRMVAGSVSTPNRRDVRAAAVLALGRFNLDDAIPYIEFVLKDDPSLFVRTQAILALGVSGKARASETLVHIYEDETEGAELRIYAIAGLGLISDSLSVDVLRRALDEKSLEKTDNQLRDATLLAAGVSGHPLLIQPLITLMDTHIAQERPSVRAFAAMSLARMAKGSDRAAVLAALSDRHSQVRRAVSAGLAGNPGPFDDEFTATLIERLDAENDAATHLNLIHVLSKSRTDAAVLALHELLKSGNMLVQAHTAIALGVQGDSRSMDPLRKQLKKAHGTSLIAALSLALGLLGDTEAQDTIAGLLPSGHAPSLQGYAALALGFMGASNENITDSIDRIIREGHHVEQNRLAILALGLLGERSRLEEIAEALPELGGVVDRASLLYGLGQAGDRRTLDNLLAVIADETEPPYIRAYALQAVGELCDPRKTPPLSRLSRHTDLYQNNSFLFDLYRAF